MAITIDYAQPLRAIGQALEILKMESFELEPDGDDFVVRGKVTARGGDADVESAESRNLRFNGEGEQNLEAPDAEPVATPAIVNRLDLCYTLKDVDRLEQKGQARRGEAPAAAQTPGLSHLLRTIGAYLEEKPARLVKIVKDRESVTVIYETLSAIRFEEKLDSATLRDWETQMFIKRGSRDLR
ncbi:MAG: hypothetical protein Q8S00_24630 [Deltaproteobacteria bacterium]|nr:hypothetical protein [Deltaproteobacteria bacterium]MDZ4341058.1 hypothetical protein [Candidatus Binatia bacterium]